MQNRTPCRILIGPTSVNKLARQGTVTGMKPGGKSRIGLSLLGGYLNEGAGLIFIHPTTIHRHLYRKLLEGKYSEKMAPRARVGLPRGTNSTQLFSMIRTNRTFLIEFKPKMHTLFCVIMSPWLRATGCNCLVKLWATFWND